MPVPIGGQGIRAADMDDPSARGIPARKDYAEGRGHDADEHVVLKDTVDLCAFEGGGFIAAIERGGFLSQAAGEAVSCGKP